MRPILLLLAVSITILPRLASAHAGGHAGPLPPQDLWSAWTFDPVVIGPMALALGLYVRGTSVLWRRAGTGRGVRPWQAGCFAAGMAALVLALIWPIDRLAESLLTAHMAQHVLLIVVAPPLLVLGMPLPPMVRGLPESWRHALGAVAQRRSWRSFWAAASSPWLATLLHGLALWGWHVPAAFEAADRDAFLHAAEHASFLGTALLFWWSVLRVGRSDGFGFGLGALCVLVTLIHSGFLGVLLTFAPAPLYALDPEGPASWGLTPLEDQQLAGLIMWIPAGTIYLLAGLGLVAAWLKAIEQRRGSPPFLSGS